MAALLIPVFVMVKAKMAEMLWHFNCCDNAASRNEWLFNLSSSRVPLNSSRGVLFPHLSGTHSCLFMSKFFNTVFKTFEIRGEITFDMFCYLSLPAICNAKEHLIELFFFKKRYHKIRYFWLQGSKNTKGTV